MGGNEPNVSVADAAYLLAYVGLAAALVLGTVVRTGAGARIDPESIIDALTIIVVSVLIFWDLSIAAIVADTTVSGFTRFVWATYPVLDAILLAMVARVLMTGRSRSTIGLAFAVRGCLLAGRGHREPAHGLRRGRRVPRCRLDARCDADDHLGLATTRLPPRTRSPTMPAGPSVLEAGHRDRPDPDPAGAALRRRPPGRRGARPGHPDQRDPAAGAQLCPERSTPAVRESCADRGPREPGRRTGGVARQVGVPGHHEP